MKRAIIQLGVLLITLSCALSHSASKDKNKFPPQEAAVPNKVELGAWRGSQIMGIVVYDADGVRVGSIADIIGDVKGRVIYAILSHGGVLGIGDKLIPLPWSMISPGDKIGTLKIKLSKEALERVPNFAGDNWPDFSKSEWNTKMQDYYEKLPHSTDGRQ